MERMPAEIVRLLQRNNEWASKVVTRNPSFFEQSASTPQEPQYLWLSCADSRVPVNEILGGLPPGEIFVQRNIANIVHPTDMSLMSVLTYAVEHLKVKHIIICGHYGCGGVKAGLAKESVDLLDLWLRPIKDIQQQHAQELRLVADEDEKFKIMCELNTLNSANSIAYTNVVQRAWNEGRELTIRAWIYDLSTGLIRDLDFTISSINDISEGYRFVIEPQNEGARNSTEKQFRRISQVRAVRNERTSIDRLPPEPPENSPPRGREFDNGPTVRERSIGRGPIAPRDRSIGRQNNGNNLPPPLRSGDERQNFFPPPFAPRTSDDRSNYPPMSAPLSTSSSISKAILRIRLRHSASDQVVSLAVPATQSLAAEEESMRKILIKISNGLSMHGIDPSRSKVLFLDRTTGDALDVVDSVDFAYVLNCAKAVGMGLGLAPLEFVVVDR
ncbi:hypothetical protein HK096_003272 [Nowakowskiella sp. JEL0078]|nr:hypothetical protein HK096_003272 [Nowakowskiella sp. JEL0078]